MKFTHIYLDLDGVLSDFHSEYGNHTKEEWLEEFPKFVYRGGFAHLKILDDARELMEYVDSLGCHVTILSSAGGVDELYHDIVIQKHSWLSYHNIKYPALVVPNKQMKAKYATRTSILIDDQDVNTNNFFIAGGFGIKHTSAINTIKELKRLI